MQPIIYDVAVSLDGFISGPGGDVTKFAHEGAVVDDYNARLRTYTTAIMGRRTYEFGYAYGLEPGMNPYPHMRSFVFSRGADLPNDGDVTQVSEGWLGQISALKTQSAGPIYLCGGGDFAGRLLDAGLIDRLILKRAPCVYGAGVSLFGGRRTTQSFNRVDTKTYASGYVLDHLDVS